MNDIDLGWPLSETYYKMQYWVGSDPREQLRGVRRFLKDNPQADLVNLVTNKFLDPDKKDAVYLYETTLTYEVGL